MIALIDYDAGNIKSVEKAFQSCRHPAERRDLRVLTRLDPWSVQPLFQGFERLFPRFLYFRHHNR